jgi:2-oxoglutarate dehydrogenase E1 component
MSSGISAVKPSVNAWNADYLDAQYAAYRADPESIAPDLRSFFQGFDLALSSGAAAAGSAPVSSDAVQTRFEFGVRALVDAYRRSGHLAARLDPLGNPRSWRGRPPVPPELSLEAHGLSQADLGRECSPGLAGLPARTTLGAVVDLLRAVYTGTTGAEVMHVTDPRERAWLLERLERDAGKPALTNQVRTRILQVLVNCEQFERFVHVRYQGKKRFSVEGAEATIVALDACLESLGAAGVQETVLGMAHRGRLNVLHNIVGMSFEQLFIDFEESWEDEFARDGGDVKYHRGYSGDRTLMSGVKMRVSLSANPSHLEAVDPIVAGRVRGKQRLRGDTKERRSVAPILVHGDAAVIGQGLVAELTNMAGLEGYTVGGTLHVVTNNMLGFTTVPTDGRTSEYCTDGSKVTGCPVLHVNGEDPEACVRAAIIASEYRQAFGKDVWVDLWCYRKYGHNETDEPGFTQPVMYEQIREKSKSAPLVQLYARSLVDAGVVSEQWLKDMQGELTRELDAAQVAAQKSPRAPGVPPGQGRWAEIDQRYTFEQPATGVSEDMLREVCATFDRLPEGFTAHRVVAKVLAERAALPTTRKISWGDAESLAFGTLLLEGFGVRVSGQDCRRGTFGHRHAVVRDQATGAPYMPLNAMRPVAERPDDYGPGKQGRLCVYDSPLSELAVMAFDYGYSLTDPRMLVCWEGQFGDFSNGAQALIDQFISSGEIKWERWSSLVLLLPHGQEGMGPEHSSCRPERFLQLCGSDAMQVVWPSTGAQAFHMLRRQMHARFRKPLIVMTPKSQLRLQSSTLDELVTGRFQTIIDDPRYAGAKSADRRAVRRVILCSGKIYHELATKREESSRDDTAIVRVEQIYPFDAGRLGEVLAPYPDAAQRVWVQEEPRNQGAYLFLADAIRQTLGFELAYVGRPAHATPASGSDHRTKELQQQVLAQAINWSEPVSLRPSRPSGTPAASNGDHRASNGSPAKPAPSVTAKSSGPAKSSPSSRSGKR